MSEIMAFNGHKVDRERCRSAVYTVVGRNRLRGFGYWRLWCMLLVFVPLTVLFVMHMFTNANNSLAAAYMAMSWALVAFIWAVVTVAELFWRAFAIRMRTQLIEQLLTQPCLTVHVRKDGDGILAESSGAATMALPLDAALDLIDGGFRDHHPVGGGPVKFVCDDAGLIPLCDVLNAVYAAPERVWIDTMADYVRPAYPGHDDGRVR